MPKEKFYYSGQVEGDGQEPDLTIEYGGREVYFNGKQVDDSLVNTLRKDLDKAYKQMHKEVMYVLGYERYENVFTLLEIFRTEEEARLAVPQSYADSEVAKHRDVFIIEARTSHDDGLIYASYRINGTWVTKNVA